MVFRFLPSLFFFIFCGVAIAQPPVISKKHVRIKSANESSWSPGIVRENSSPAGGNIYEINIRIRKRGDYDFHGIIAANENLDVEVIEEGGASSPQNFKKCSRWTLVARSNRNSPQQIGDELKKTIAQSGPANGWLLYSFDGQKFLTPIKEYEHKSEGEKIP